MTPEKPQGTTLAKRRRLKMPSVANMSLGSHKTRRWQTDAKRRDATTTQDSTFANTIPGNPQNITLKKPR
jgi:hypothetical protein